MKTIMVILAIGLALFLMDRICLWLEAKGWLYYRHQKSPGGFVGSALLELNSFLQPSVRHVIEVKQNQVQYRRSEADAASDSESSQLK